MPGFIPDEGKNLIAKLVHARTYSADRDADLELGLFTNAAPDATITEATITEPVGLGYARIVLTDATWSIIAALSAYAIRTWTAGVGGWAGAVFGYFVATKSAGGTKRLLYVEIDTDPLAPYTLAENDTYAVTPNVTVV